MARNLSSLRSEERSSGIITRTKMSCCCVFQDGCEFSSGMAPSRLELESFLLSPRELSIALRRMKKLTFLFSSQSAPAIPEM